MDRSKNFWGLAIFAFFLTFLMFTSGNAMNVYAYNALPDFGLGGSARDIYRTNDAYVVTGYVRTSPTTVQACKWEGPTYDAVLLPGLGGPNSVGDTGTHEVGHFAGTVGSAQNPGGVWKPVLWTESSNDAISVHQLPTLGGPTGAATDVTSKNGHFLIVGTTDNALGNPTATFYDWLETQPVVVKNLGTLGGLGSEAHGLVTETVFPILGIVGRAQTASGEWHACSWKSFDNGMTWSIQDRSQVGSENLVSILNNIAGTELGTSATCGWATFPSSIVKGFMDYTDDADSTSRILLDVILYPNTSPTDVERTEYGARVVGTAWNNPSNKVPVLWNYIEGSASAKPYPLAMVQDPNQDNNPTFEALSSNDTPNGMSAMCGNAIQNGITVPAVVSAMSFELMFDSVFVPPSGRGGQPHKVDETLLWHNDGRIFKMAVERRSQGPMVVQAGLVSVFNQAETLSSSVVMRTYGNAPAAQLKANVVVKALDVNGQWVQIGSHTIDGSAQAYEFGPVPAAAFNLPNGQMQLKYETDITDYPVKGIVINMLRAKLD